MFKLIEIDVCNIPEAKTVLSRIYAESEYDV